MRENINQIFAVALKKAFEGHPRGIKALTAKRAGIYASTINDLLTQRREGAESTRRAIAQSLGYSYEDFLDIGRLLLAGEATPQPSNGLRLADDGQAVRPSSPPYSDRSEERPKACEDILTAGGQFTASTEADCEDAQPPFAVQEGSEKTELLELLRENRCLRMKNDLLSREIQILRARLEEIKK